MPISMAVDKYLGKYLEMHGEDSSYGDVSNGAWQHAEPAPEDIRAQIDGGQAVEVVGEGEGQQRTQPQERHHLQALLADGSVDGCKFGVVLGKTLDLHETRWMRQRLEQL